MNSSNRVSQLLELVGHFETTLESTRSRQAAAARALLDSFSDLPDAELPALDARVRLYAAWPGAPTAVGLRGAMRSPDAAVARTTAAIASWNRDGYLRQVAVERLGLDLPWSLGLLAIRTTDWVPEVRTAATAQLTQATPDAFASRLGLLEGLLRRERGAALADLLDLRFEGGDGLIALARFRSEGDHETRRACWRWLEDKHPQHARDDLDLALQDDDVLVRVWAGKQVEQLSTDRRRPLAATLREDSVGRLRAEGLRMLVMLGNADDELERGLRDRSRAVRSVAQFYVARFGGHPAKTYRAQLRHSPSAVGIAGLGESGTAGDRGLLIPFLLAPSPKVRATALRSLARLGEPALHSHAERSLSDPAPRVARAALDVLRRQRIAGTPAERLLRIADGEPRPAIRAGLLALLRSSPWAWLLGALRALDDMDASVVAAGHRELDLWMRRSARLATAPPPAWRSEIERHLERLPQAPRHEISFVMRTARA